MPGPDNLPEDKKIEREDLPEDLQMTLSEQEAQGGQAAPQAGGIGADSTTSEYSVSASGGASASGAYSSEAGPSSGSFPVNVPQGVFDPPSREDLNFLRDFLELPVPQSALQGLSAAEQIRLLNDVYYERRGNRDEEQLEGAVALDVPPIHVQRPEDHPLHPLYHLRTSSAESDTSAAVSSTFDQSGTSGLASQSSTAASSVFGQRGIRTASMEASEASTHATLPSDQEQPSDSSDCDPHSLPMSREPSMDDKDAC